jgi:hypothetical protein
MAQHFYDGQIRRYVGQIIRAISGFKYKSGDGKLTTIPVTYGDMTRQVASIIRDNSENKIPTAPRMAVYISGVALDRSRLGDATHVSKVHIREREKVYDTDTGEFLGYSQNQGDNYTVERIMPTPYKLTVKADIWSTNTDQKLQIMEQIMMMFNPSLEIQTTDNFVDWSSLSVLELTDINFSSRTIPVGTESDIDVATLTFESPIWISPPSKVKRLGVIQDIIMNVFDQSYTFATDERGMISGFDIFVYYNKDTEQYYAELLDPTQVVEELQNQFSVAKDISTISWSGIIDLFPGKYRAGSTQLFLRQPNGNEVVGTVAISAIDPTKLIVNFDQDTYPTNTVILGVNGSTRGTVNAIVDPQNQGPGAATYNFTKLTDITEGTRYLLINDIGDPANSDGSDSWKNADGSDFWAKANDIVEWDGTAWSIIMESAGVNETVYVTNSRTGVQYKFEDGEWTRSFEGEYSKGRWRLIL